MIFPHLYINFINLRKIHVPQLEKVCKGCKKEEEVGDGGRRGTIPEISPAHRKWTDSFNNEIHF